MDAVTMDSALSHDAPLHFKIAIIFFLNRINNDMMDIVLNQHLGYVSTVESF